MTKAQLEAARKCFHEEANEQLKLAGMANDIPRMNMHHAVVHILCALQKACIEIERVTETEKE
jgi:hypothetical protein